MNVVTSWYKINNVNTCIWILLTPDESFPNRHKLTRLSCLDRNGDYETRRTTQKIWPKLNSSSRTMKRDEWTARFWSRTSFNCLLICSHKLRNQTFVTENQASPFLVDRESSCTHYEIKVFFVLFFGFRTHLLFIAIFAPRWRWCFGRFFSN